MNVIFPRSPEIESRAADWFRAVPGAYFTCGFSRKFHRSRGQEIAPAFGGKQQDPAAASRLIL